MGLITEKVKINVTSKNLRHYQNLVYNAYHKEHHGLPYDFGELTNIKRQFKEVT